MVYSGAVDQTSAYEWRPKMPREFGLSNIDPDVHLLPSIDVPCSNDLDAFIQVYKRKGNERYERLMHNRKVDYFVDYILHYFVFNNHMDVVDYDPRLPDVRCMVRRSLIEFKDLDWQGADVKRINKELKNLNAELAKLLVGYFAFLTHYRLMQAENNHSVLHILHSEAAQLAGLHPLDFKWRRWDLVMYDEAVSQIGWDEYREYLLMMEVWVDGAFLDIKWSLEHFVQRILRNQYVFYKLWYMKQQHEMLDRQILRMPKELSYLEDVRYSTLQGLDMMRFYAREKMAWSIYERTQFIYTMRSFFTDFNDSMGALSMMPGEDNTVLTEMDVLSLRRTWVQKEMTRDHIAY